MYMYNAFLKHDNCRNFYDIVINIWDVVLRINALAKFVNGQIRSKGWG